jgi:hypothetical protein
VSVEQQSPVRADLLLALERAGSVTATELRLPVELSVERYEAVGRMLGKLGSSVRWWLGDWLLYGEELFGHLAPQLAEVLGMSPEAMEDALRVARAFPPDPRREGLSWSHHRVVARLWIGPVHQERLLAVAERDRLNTRELEGHVRELRERLDGAPRSARQGSAEGSVHVPPAKRDLSARATQGEGCVELAEETLTDLLSDLRACGFPVAGLTLSLDTGAGELIVTATEAV